MATISLRRLIFTITPIGSLNKGTTFELQAHSLTSTQSEPWALPTTWSFNFMFILLSSPFPRSATLLSISQEYLALQGTP